MMADKPEFQPSLTWTKERWEGIHELLQSTLELAPEQRAGFLRDKCAGDEALLREVESLLSAHDRAGSFLEGSAFDLAPIRWETGQHETLSGRKVGPYELLSLIGSGGMGEVYRATDTRLKRDVAVKFLAEESSLDEKRLQYFEREARLASSLNHPNIVTIYDIGRSESGPFIAMELVEGKTLREILASGLMPLKRALQIGAQVAAGLARAHVAGVFHRDLKPENVMVTREGLVKILDFGLAKLAPPSDTGESKEPRGPQVSKPGMILGTVGYMSPEQASGLQLDFRSDQFSLGIILYEMMAGKSPFERNTSVETLSAIIRDEPEPLALINPKTPAPCLWIINRCLAKNPEERYASTSDLATDLANVRDHLGELSASHSRVRRFINLKQSRVLALAGLCALALIGVLVVLWLNGSQAPPSVAALTFANGHPTASRFMPDGESVIYGAGWVGQERQLYITSIRAAEARPLGVKYTGIWAVSPSGTLAVSSPCLINWGDCMGTLAQVPPGSVEPRQVLERVTSADWTKDGSLVAAQFVERRGRIVQVGVEKSLYESDGWITDIRVSPDGSRIAFVDHPILGDVSGSVCVLDLTPGAEPKVLSEGWTVLQGLAWRPDSREIWFTGHRQGRGLSASLFAVTLSGKERPVYSAPGGLWIDDISRDGRRVLMRSVVPRATIIALAPGESKERDLTRFDFSTVGDLSADGKTLLYYEWGAAVKGKHTTYLRSTDGSEPRLIGEGKPLALSPTHRWALVRKQTRPPQLALLPTGTGQEKLLARGSISEFTDWAVWLDTERIIFSASEPGRRARTYIQDIDEGLPEPVTADGITGVLLSPNGRLVAAVDKYQGHWLYPLDGGHPRALDGVLEDDVLIQWSDDGQTIFLRDSSEDKLNIYKLDLTTGSRTLWKPLSPPYPAGLVGIGYDPGEIRMTPDGRFYAYTFWTGVGGISLIEGLK